MLNESKFLNPLEVKEMRGALSLRAKSRNRRDVMRWMIIDLGLQTGLRASEMCDLLIDDIHIGYGQSSIFVRCGKGGKMANIIINESLKAHIKKYLKWLGAHGGHLLVTERGESFSRQGLHGTVKRIYKSMKFPERYNVHSLRHTFCSELYRNTQNLRLVQQQARHSDPMTTTRYANLLNAEIKDGMEALYS